jgi:enoyl-CoA hydratase
MELILTADRMDAEEAHRLGLVNHVVDPDDVMPTARGIADRICRNAPLAIRESRAIARAALEITEDEAWRRSAEAAGRIFQTEDAREGPTAFAQKREPQWKGR